MEISRLKLLFFTFLKTVSTDGDFESRYLLQITQEIFPDDYNKYEPPFRGDKPAHVYLTLSIMDLDKIDDGLMEFSIQSYLAEFWMDYRLNLSRFQQNSNNNPIFPTYLSKYLWVPDLVFDNTKNGMLFHLSLPNTSIKVLKDGTLFRTSRYNLIVGCQMNFQFYPMDTQECYVKIATLSYPDNKLLLHWSKEIHTGDKKSISFTTDIQPLKYVLQEPRSYKSTEQWITGNFTYLYANFTFVRRLSGSLFNVYVPSTLVVFLSWISFWLDIEAVPARVTLGVTSLLTLATQVVQAHTGLPPISYMTAMDVWLFACLIAVFGSLIEFAFSYQLHVKNKKVFETAVEERPAQRGSKEFRDAEWKPDSLPAVDKMRKEVGNEGQQEEIQILRPRIIKKDSVFGWFTLGRQNSITSEKFPTEKKNRKSLDSVCQKIFPASFSLFAVIYWTYYLLP